MNTDALQALSSGQKKKPVKAAWRLPEASDFVVGAGRAIVAVDQSLSGCAAVLLLAGRDVNGLTLRVHKSSKFPTTPVAAGGYEETLQRAVELHGKLRSWLVSQAVFGGGGFEVVHEQPPIGGGRVVRPESSLLASLALRLAIHGVGALQRMVAPQTHKYFICGDRKATKAQHHAVLKDVAVDLGIEGMHLVTNEDLRDALSISLLHLTREPENYNE
jgi:hypothetical protein